MAFCDLAGSERAQKSLSIGCRLKEASNINTDLFTLGKCLEAIRSNQQTETLGGAASTTSSSQRAVPFRDCKLTRLFQNYLAAPDRRSRIFMIVNFAPTANTFDESLNVLKFSALAQQVVCFL